MKQIYPITDMNHPDLACYVGNRETHLLRCFEPEPGLFIAETRTVIALALRQGYQPCHVVCTEKMLADDILNSVGEVPIYVVDEEAAKKQFGYVLTGGISCAMRRRPKIDCQEILAQARRIVVLEDVENPTNVGAIFRSAAALGMDAVLLSPSCADPLYRRAIRVSTGNVFLMPWAYLCDQPWQWQQQGLSLLRQHGFTTAALALREDNLDVDDPILKQTERLALLLGNEGRGLTDATIQACDYVVKIPMQSGVDSLNVGAAAAIAMWELGKGLARSGEKG